MKPGEVAFDHEPTLEELRALGLGPRVSRTLLAVYNDLVLLTGQQKTLVWNNLTSGSPAKVLNYVGQYSGTIWAFHWAATNGTLPGAALNDAKLRAAACYVLDHPSYLVHPGFDPTINVPGDQPE